MALDDDIAALAAEVPAERARVLVVDDETLFARAVVRHLERAGFACEHAGTLRAARAAVEARPPDLLLLDMRLPDGSGLDFLGALGPRSAPPVVVMTAYGEVADAVAAMKRGAVDYLKKPLDLPELSLVVERVLAQRELRRRLEYSRAREEHLGERVELVGEAPAMRALVAQVERIAALAGAGSTPPTVLISGETGTGKDVTARLLHQRSARAGRPFVHVDCAALPKDLIEAELFGHVKGAFTHATSERTGPIEAAEDGVVFLDEIGELPLELQAKLLAVLERRSLRRLGSSSEQRTAAWFIAATNRDVEAMVAAGTLRADLYFRLNVLTLALPPLRERGEDVLLLAERFLRDTARRYSTMPPRFTAAARERLRAYPWPGNVRELGHVVERAVLLAGGSEIDGSGLALPASAGAAPAALAAPDFGALTLEAMERMMLERALAQSNHNVSEAARRLGITRMAMRYRLQKHGLGP